MNKIEFKTTEFWCIGCRKYKEVEYPTFAHQQLFEGGLACPKCQNIMVMRNSQLEKQLRAIEKKPGMS